MPTTIQVTPRPLPRPLGAAINASTQLLKAAEKSAAAMLAEAEQQALAHRDTLLAGAQALLNQQLSAITDACSHQLQRQRELLVEHWQSALYQLCIEVVGEQLASTPSSINARIERVLREVGHPDSLQLQLHPSSLPHVAENPHIDVSAVALRENDALAPSEALLLTESGSILLRPEEHLLHAATHAFARIGELLENCDATST